MLRIRLSRVGKKGHPSYRIVVADVAAPRDGAYLEWIGNYDPMTNPPSINIKEDRAQHWLNLGAQPSDAVLRILDKNGVRERTPQERTRKVGAAAVATEEPAAAAAPAVEAAPEDAPADEPVADEPVAEEPTAEDAPADEPEADAAVDEAAEEPEEAAPDVSEEPAEESEE